MGNKLSVNCSRVGPDSNTINNEVKNLSLIWLDSSLPDSFSSDLLSIFNELQDTMNQTLKVFDDEIECYGHIRETSLNNKLIIIIPNGYLCNYLIPLVYRFCQVAVIFIYYLVNDDQQQGQFDYAKHKVKSIPIDQLFKRIKDFKARWFRYWEENYLSVNIFKEINKKDFSSCSINGSFLFNQLLIDTLLQLPCQATDMNEFIEIYAKQFSDNQKLTDDLHTFSNDYKSEEALRWYTKPIFLYSLLNKALRIQNIELLFYLRFFIRDIYSQLTKNQCQSPIRVYRGQLISLEEIETLKDSVGDLISINSFFSTSLSREQAEFYIKGATLKSSDNAYTNGVSVLFEISADPSSHRIERRPFANITKFSVFEDDEEEVLFMVGSIYRILAVYEEDNKYIVSLELSGDIEEDMQALMDYLKKDRRISVDSTASLSTFVDLLHDMGKVDLAEKFAKRLLREITGSAKSEAVNFLEIAQCHFYIGYAAKHHNRFTEALEKFNLALHYVCLMNDPNVKAVASIYTAIANNFNQQKQDNYALEYYKKALATLREENDKHRRELAVIYTSMATVYQNKKDYAQARDYYQKALEIRDENLPPIHAETVNTYVMLARLHFALREYEQALEYCQQAIDIAKKSLTNDHSGLAIAYEMMAVICQSAGDLECAKDYFAKASAIDHRTILVPRSRFNTMFYTCPWCQHRVWIYTMFRFLQGAPCFRCLRRRIGIRR